MNKLVDQYNNIYYHSIGKKLINADYSALTERFKTNCKTHWSRKIFINDSVLKTNPWTFKLKDLTGEKLIGSFYEKELLLSK